MCRYGAFPTDLITYLWRAKQPYNVSVASETAALAALRNSGYMDDVRERLVAERGRLAAGLEGISFLSPYPSEANFVLCKARYVLCMLCVLRAVKRGCPRGQLLCAELWAVVAVATCAFCMHVRKTPYAYALECAEVWKSEPTEASKPRSAASVARRAVRASLWACSCVYEGEVPLCIPDSALPRVCAPL